LDASERIFAEKGYHATGIANIATELGIGHGTFYRYFKSKHDIALHVFDSVMPPCSAVHITMANNSPGPAWRCKSRFSD